MQPTFHGIFRGRVICLHAQGQNRFLIWVRLFTSFSAARKFRYAVARLSVAVMSPRTIVVTSITVITLSVVLCEQIPSLRDPHL
jgi:hypothetical protein